MTHQTTSQEIREIRELRGWSQREAGFHFGVTHSTIAAWERGEWKPRRSRLMTRRLKMMRAKKDRYLGQKEHLWGWARAEKELNMPAKGWLREMVSYRLLPAPELRVWDGRQMRYRITEEWVIRCKKLHPERMTRDELDQARVADEERRRQELLDFSLS